MRLLLDECVPRPLKTSFAGHEILTIDEAGLKGLKNGILLNAARERFDVLITVDKNIEYQQNRRDLPIAIIIFSAHANRVEFLLPLLPKALMHWNLLRKARSSQ